MVKIARKKRGLTLEQLAEKSGVSRSMLSTIERGEVNPTFSVVWSLTQTLGISLNQLDEGTGSNPMIEHIHAYSTPSQSSPDGLATLLMLSPRTTVLPVEWHLLKNAAWCRIGIRTSLTGHIRAPNLYFWVASS